MKLASDSSQQNYPVMGRLNSGEEKIDSRFSKEIIHNKRNYGSFQIKSKSSANSKQ